MTSFLHYLPGSLTHIYSSHSRLVQGAMWICIVIIYAIYCGNLTASLAAPRIPWPFIDLKGLAESNEYTMIIQKGSVREELIKASWLFQQIIGLLQ